MTKQKHYKSIGIEREAQIEKIIKHNKQTLNVPEFIRGKIKKKLRESPTREFIVSELMAHTGSPCYNKRKTLFKFKL